MHWSEGMIDRIAGNPLSRTLTPLNIGMALESQVRARWTSGSIVYSDFTSTALLQAIADKLIPGLPHSLRIVLVSQVTDSARALGVVLDEAGKPVEELTVLQHVIQGDIKRAHAMREFNCELLITASSQGS